jgi:hypothetical protein
MKLNFFTLTSFIFLLSGCSTSFTEFFNNKADAQQRNEELIKSFEGEEKVLEKFKEKEHPPVVEKVEKKITKNKKKVTQKKAPVKKAVKAKPTKVIIKKSRYPKDHPQEFIEIDNMTKKYWAKFKPTLFEGEQIIMDINYLGVSTGKVAITTMPSKKIGGIDTYHFHARAKTSTYYSYLYELDDNVDSYVNKTSFTPVKFSLIQRQSGQNIDDLQLFDSDSLQSYIFYKRDRDGKIKKNKETKPTPIRFQDAFSVLFFLRGLPYEKDEVYTVPMMNKGKVLILKAKGTTNEEINTDIGKIDAIKVVASTQYSGDTLKSGDMTFWFSNDERRIFLKFAAKIKIGSISGEIEKYER